MTDHATLAAALAAVQAELPTVHKGNRATVPTKSGGNYSYTYADLGDVSAAALPLLSSHGLAWLCKPRLGEKGWELVGTLLHTSGEREEGTLPLSGGAPQEWGSSITYMRRYLLGSMTGLVTDDDDDGNSAQTAAKRAPRAAQRPAQPPASPAAPPAGSDAPAATDTQRKRMHALLGELGITDRDKYVALAAWSANRPITSTSDLNAHEVAHFIDYLAQRAAHDKEATK